MKALRPLLALSLTALLLSTPFYSVARAERERPIVLGQTEGFADGKLTVFDYGQNFICANAPRNNADCLVGMGFTSLALPGVKLNSADIPDLIVIVPFFVASPPTGPDDDDFAGVEALDPTPDVFVQCPETKSSGLAGGTPFGQFGHCILHDTMLDTSAVASVVGASEIPLPNHSHIVAATPGNPNQPWDTKVVLVTNPALWPNANGMCSGSPCLTSFDAVAAAAGLDADGNGTLDIIGPVDTTLVLFFGVHGLEP